MNGLENGEGHLPMSSNSDAPSRPTGSDMIGRIRTWRLAVYAFAAVFVLSLALSDSGDLAAKTLAYIGVGGMIVSILGMGMVVTKGETPGSRVSRARRLGSQHCG